MPLNRSQFLQGDTSEGPVLAGKVQGVKEGSGTKIASDGTISVFADTAIGLVRTNNPSAFNNYIWPNTDGEAKTFLRTDGAGNVTWEYPSNSPVVHIGSTPPVDALPGQLWFNSAKKQTFIFNNVDGNGNQWDSVHHGLDIIVENFTAEPAFVGGDGSEDSEGGGIPYTVESEVTPPGSVLHFGTAITITGLAPYQHVPIVDESAQENGHRFGVSNNQANEEGILVFSPTFFDFPVSNFSTAYVATFRVGYENPAYIRASISIVAPLSLISAGVIAGTPNVAEELNYTAGVATGGTPPYAYTWTWQKGSDSSVIQEDGDSLIIPPSLFGDSVKVEITATDARNNKATLATAVYPAPPDSIGKGPFPNTDILYPEFGDSTADTIWRDASTTLFANGCVEFTTDAGVTWGQGARSIANGGTITTRWLDTSDCLQKPNGTLISGCIYSDSYQDCGDLIVDKLPSPFTFNPAADVPLSSTVVSNSVTPIGYNVKSYVSYSGSSNGSLIQGSLDGGATWATIPLIGEDSFPISPGETLTVRMDVGDQNETAYVATINIGQGFVVQSADFVATTAAVTIFSTGILFPVTTYQGYDAEPAPSVIWDIGDNGNSIVASGCIEFRKNAGAWTQASTAMATGDTLETRWLSSAGCGGASHGLTISGTISDGGSKTISGSLKIDRVPANFSFANQIDRSTGTEVTSNTINLSGFNAAAYLSHSNVGTSLADPLQASVDGGVWGTVPDTGGTSIVLQPTVPGNPLRTLQVRGTTGGSSSTQYTVRFQAGSGTSALVSSTWRVSTSDVVVTIGQPSIISPVNGAKNLNPNSSAPSRITLISSDYEGLNGAGAHASSSWEVRKGSTGGSTIVAVSNDTENLTSYDILLGSLEPASTYYARVRYHSTDPVDSQWSPWIQFGTASAFSLTWVKRWSSSYTSGRIPERVHWSGSMFYVAGNSDHLIKSPDGKIWNKTHDVFKANGSWGEGGWFYGNNIQIRAMATNGNTTYFSGEDGVMFKTTNNGSSLQEIETVGATTTDIYGMAYGNGVLVAVGSSGVIQTCTNDGVTWNLRNSGTSSRIQDVIFHNGTFWAVAEESKILSSNNGVTWNLVNLPNAPDRKDFNRIAALGSTMVIVRYESNYIMVSSDSGSSWTQHTAPDKFQFVNSGGIWFVAGGSYGGDPIRLYSSPDGVNWTKDFQDLAQDHNHDMAYSPELGRWAAAAHDYTMYSTT